MHTSILWIDSSVVLYSVVVSKVEGKLVCLLRLELLKDHLRWEWLEQRLVHTHTEILQGTNQPTNAMAAMKLCKCIIMSRESKIYGDLLWDMHTLTERDKR